MYSLPINLLHCAIVRAMLALTEAFEASLCYRSSLHKVAAKPFVMRQQEESLFPSHVAGLQQVKPCSAMAPVTPRSCQFRHSHELLLIFFECAFASQQSFPLGLALSDCFIGA